jgi:hypothetical protein
MNTIKINRLLIGIMALLILQACSKPGEETVSIDNKSIIDVEQTVGLGERFTISSDLHNVKECSWQIFDQEVAGNEVDSCVEVTDCELECYFDTPGVKRFELSAELLNGEIVTDVSFTQVVDEGAVGDNSAPVIKVKIDQSGKETVRVGTFSSYNTGRVQFYHVNPIQFDYSETEDENKETLIFKTEFLQDGNVVMEYTSKTFSLTDLRPGFYTVRSEVKDEQNAVRGKIFSLEVVCEAGYNIFHIDPTLMKSAVNRASAEYGYFKFNAVPPSPPPITRTFFGDG